MAGSAGGSLTRGRRATLAALLVNIALAGAKAAAFTVTGATTLLAECLHSCADAGTQSMLLIGGRRARLETDDDNPVAFGRERYFWAFVLAVVLFAAAAAGSIYRGLEQLDSPEAITTPHWGYLVLGAALVGKIATLRATVRAGDEARRLATWRRYLRNARSPEVPVVAIEEVGAIFGLLAALGGLAASEITGDASWDAVGALAVGGLLTVKAVVLVAEMKPLLIGSSASARDIEIITAAIAIDPSVIRLVRLRAQRNGPDEMLVGAEVELDHELTFPEVCEVVKRIERNVRQAVPAARTMFIEADVDEARRAPPAVDEHLPSSDIPDEVREILDAEARKGALGSGIVIEADDQF